MIYSKLTFFSRIYVDVIEILFIRVSSRATNYGGSEEDAYDFSLPVEDDGTGKCQTYLLVTCTYMYSKLMYMVSLDG